MLREMNQTNMLDSDLVWRMQLILNNNNQKIKCLQFNIFIAKETWVNFLALANIACRY